MARCEITNEKAKNVCYCSVTYTVGPERLIEDVLDFTGVDRTGIPDTVAMFCTLIIRVIRLRVWCFVLRIAFGMLHHVLQHFPLWCELL